MRMAGGLLVILCGTFWGFRAARRLEERAERIRLLRQLVTYFAAELQAALPTVPALLCAAAENPAFVRLDFLQRAAENAAAFPACWGTALARDTSLTLPERAAMVQTGDILGSTALEGQLALLRLQAERLSDLQRTAEQESQRRGDLCRSLGVLGGIFAVILLLGI